MISFPDLLKKVFAIYAANFRFFLAVLGLTIVWNVALAFIPINLEQVPRWIGPIIGISLLISLFTELLLVGTFSRLLEGQPLHGNEIATAALRRFPLYFALIVSWTLIIILGALLAVVPAIIFATWFMFISSTFLIEHQGVVSAFKRSRALVGGYFFPLLLRAGGIMLTVFFITSAANQGLFAILNALVPATAFRYAAIGNSAFGSILSALAMPIISGTLVTLYYEMRKIKTT